MANQTIIQAAGQRYAPRQVDYSGYFNGIATVATALIEKRKAGIKKSQTLGAKEKKSGIVGFENILASLRYLSGKSSTVHSIYDNFLEAAAINKRKLEDFEEDLEDVYKDMSFAVSLQDENYWATVEDNGIRSYRKLMVGDMSIEDLFNDPDKTEKEIIDYISTYGIQDMVVGPDGEFTDISNFKTHFTKKLDMTDPNGLYRHVQKTIATLIPYSASTSRDIDAENTWNQTMLNSIAHIENLVEEDNDVLLSAMVDVKFNKKDGNRVSFMDYIFSTDEDFSDAFNKWLDEDPDGDGPYTKRREIYEEQTALKGVGDFETLISTAKLDSDVMKRVKAAILMDYHNATDLKDEFIAFMENIYRSYQ